VVAGLKSYTSHTMASCGAIETILSLYMMEAGFIAPTLNLNKIDERCAMIQHAVNLIEKDIRIAAFQNFSFDVVNTCLLIKKSTHNFSVVFYQLSRKGSVSIRR